MGRARSKKKDGEGKKKDGEAKKKSGEPKKKSGEPKKKKRSKSKGPKKEELKLPAKVRANEPPIISGGLKLNIDEVLRIGSVLERFGVDAQRREAFKWLAMHRADVFQDSDETAHKLLVAIGDLPMSRELAVAAVRTLVAESMITEQEYTTHFSVIERSPTDQHITVAQLAHLLVVSASYYKRED